MSSQQRGKDIAIDFQNSACLCRNDRGGARHVEQQRDVAKVRAIAQLVNQQPLTFQMFVHIHAALDDDVEAALQLAFVAERDLRGELYDACGVEQPLQRIRRKTREHLGKGLKWGVSHADLVRCWVVIVSATNASRAI